MYTKMAGKGFTKNLFILRSNLSVCNDKEYILYFKNSPEPYQRCWGHLKDLFIDFSLGVTSLKDLMSNPERHKSGTLVNFHFQHT